MVLSRSPEILGLLSKGYPVQLFYATCMTAIVVTVITHMTCMPAPVLTPAQVPTLWQLCFLAISRIVKIQIKFGIPTLLAALRRYSVALPELRRSNVPAIRITRQDFAPNLDFSPPYFIL